MLHSVTFTVRPTAWVVALVVVNASVGLAYAGPPGFKACQTEDVEKVLLEREKSLLGPSHAMQHSRMRQHQCEVERGTRKVPGKGVEMKASKTLEDDDNAKKAVWKRNSKVSQLRSGATPYWAFSPAAVGLLHKSLQLIRSLSAAGVRRLSSR